MIRLGILGCGAMASQHAAGVRFAELADRVRVTALYSRTKEKAEKLKDSFFKDAAVYDALPDFLENVDAVLVATPIPAHYETALACLKAGKHVLLEKPMAETEDECEELRETAERKGVVFQQGLCLRHDAGIKWLKDKTESGVFGPLRQFSLYNETYAVIPKEHWLAKIKDPRNGLLFHHGIHYIDLLLYFLGEPVSGAIISTDAGTDIRPDALCNVVLKFKDGGAGYYYCDWAAKAGSKMEFSIFAYFENATVEYNIFRGIMRVYSEGRRGGPESEGGGKLETINFTPFAYLHEQMNAFISEIEKGGKGYPTALESEKVIKLIHKLYENEYSGKTSL